MKNAQWLFFGVHLYALNRTNCKSCGKSASSDSLLSVGKK